MAAGPWDEVVARANADARQPVLFIPSPATAPATWDRWVEVFEAAGYVALTPCWPPDWRDGASPEGPRRAATAFAEVARALINRPAIVGCGFGAGVARALSGDGLSAVTVAIASEAQPPAAADTDGWPLLVVSDIDDPFERAVAEDALAFVQRFV